MGSKVLTRWGSQAGRRAKKKHILEKNGFGILLGEKEEFTAGSELNTRSINWHIAPTRPLEGHV